MTIICLHLVTPGLEGALMEVQPGKTPGFLITHGQQVPLVATGCYERKDGIEAEVWVPEDMLTLWQMEHAIDC